MFFALSSTFQYTTILLGKLWQRWKLLEFSNTSTLASYKSVSYKKECIVQYAIKKLIKYSCKKQEKKPFPSLMYHWLVWSKKFAELWVNKCAAFLFWDIRTRLIHDNTSTPSLLIDYSQTHAPSINWCFVSPSSAWFTICWWTSFPTFARTWIRLKRLGRLKLET